MRFKLFFIILLTLIYPLSANSKETGFAKRADVKKFIAHMVYKYHFQQKELTAALNTVKSRPSVIRSVKAPLEQKTWHTYQLVFVTESRIREGVAFWKKYHAALDRAERTYGVPASIIVATIGVETKYGKNVGNYRVIDALSNLAFSKSSRAHYFRNELEQFFLLTREQHLNPVRVMGSYAGAIGQPQFMPSACRYYAVNFSGSKRIDLSHNVIDVIGSIANYYKKHGWAYNEPVALKTSLQGSQYESLAERNDTSFLNQIDLSRYGISEDNQNLKLIPLKNYFGYEYWIGFHNFEVIKRYNPSNLYAMAVYQLSYYIDVLKNKTA